jgi:hypothetical protein
MLQNLCLEFIFKLHMLKIKELENAAKIIAPLLTLNRKGKVSQEK